MKIPTVNCHWINKNTLNLSSVAFDLFVLKIDDTVEEFGVDRRQTKIDSLIDGLNKYANEKLAQKLVGKKIIASTTGLPLFITTLPVDILKKMQLPQELETFVNSLSNKDPLESLMSDTVQTTPKLTNGDEKRIAFAAKELFKQLAGYLRPTFSDAEGDLYIFEVMDRLCSPEIANSILQGGEMVDPKVPNLKISFGFQKEVE